jgi:hypothetical protein
MDLSPGEIQKLERRVSEDKDGTAAHRLARYHSYFRSDPKEGEKWLRVGAALGCTEAQQELATILNGKAALRAKPDKTTDEPKR